MNSLIACSVGTANARANGHYSHILKNLYLI